MEKIFDSRPYCINDFKEWDERGELILSPFFQRRSVWSDKAKSYLMDTIIKGLPMPKIYMRHFIDRTTRKSVREIIDGQQRLRTILSFLKDGFDIMRNHNIEYGKKFFSSLPIEVQERILKYEIATDLILDSKDEIALDIFARLNTYTVKLNKQELINAKYFGLFKQTVYRLGFEFLKFWRNNKIFTDREITRMAEAEMTSELIIAAMDGIHSKKNIESYYRDYDDNFQFASKIETQFKKCMDLIGELYTDGLQSSSFSSKTLFYTLFCVIYHFQYGLPKANKKRIQLSEVNISRLRNIFDVIDQLVQDDNDHSKYKKFLDAVNVHTTDVESRKYRFEFMVKMILDKIK